MPSSLPPSQRSFAAAWRSWARWRRHAASARPACSSSSTSLRPAHAGTSSTSPRHTHTCSTFAHKAWLASRRPRTAFGDSSRSGEPTSKQPSANCTHVPAKAPCRVGSRASPRSSSLTSATDSAETAVAASRMPPQSAVIRSRSAPLRRACSSLVLCPPAAARSSERRRCFCAHGKPLGGRLALARSSSEAIWSASSSTTARAATPSASATAAPPPPSVEEDANAVVQSA
mmetsp:Transcript_66530/g.198762  ORF Transcript_66530/g.198762 Transcript_66530/m.198762 type:complete len:230 (-) Transcript_66530:788-1477(-)